MAIDQYVYSDESGIHADAKHCIVAGNIGSPREWKLLRKDWEATLEAFKVDSFHAVDFFSRRDPQYQRWDRRKQADFMRVLLEAIWARQIRPIGGAVDLNDWNSHSEVERRILTGGNAELLSSDPKKHAKWQSTGAPTKPYYLGAMLLLLQALSITAPDTIVHFTFDRQEQYEGWLRAAFGDIVRLNMLEGLGLNGQIGEVRHAPSHQQPQLQAVDLHAYICTRYLDQNPLEGTLHELAERHLASKHGRLIPGTPSRLDGILADVRRKQAPSGAAGDEQGDAT